MDRYRALEAFVRVAETGGFSAAARVLGVSTPVVSDRVKQLEELLRQPLFHRTTRYVTLTKFGVEVMPHFRELTLALGDLDTASSAQMQELQGRIRVASVIDFGISHIGPAIADFTRRHPALTVELDVGNRVVNPIEEGFDLAIHFRDVQNKDLRAWDLMRVDNGYFASPQYLRANGAPAALSDLVDHRCLGYSQQNNVNKWNVRKWSAAYEGRREVVEVALALTSNSGQVLRHYVKSGMGVAVLPLQRVQSDIEDGSLVRILPDYEPQHLMLSAIVRASDEGSYRVRALADHLRSALNPSSLSAVEIGL